MLWTEFSCEVLTGIDWQISNDRPMIDPVKIILSYDFKESCTTILVSAFPYTIDLTEIGARLSYCFRGHIVFYHEDFKKTDPFCLCRMIMAQIVECMVSVCDQRFLEFNNAATDTYKHIENPGKLKDQTLAFFAGSMHLRRFAQSIGTLESSLKKASEGSSWLFKELGTAYTVSQVKSANGDIEYLQGVIGDMKLCVVRLDETIRDILTLVRRLGNIGSNHGFR